MGTINNNLRRWTAPEDDVVREFAGKEVASLIGKRIGRGKLAVLKRIKKLNLDGIPQGAASLWTNEQMNALKSAGGEISSPEFARKWKLKERSVRWLARKFGVKFKQKRMWKVGQDDELRSCITVEEAMRRLGRTRRAVLCKAQSLGITLQSPRSGRPRAANRHLRGCLVCVPRR